MGPRLEDRPCRIGKPSDVLAPMPMCISSCISELANNFTRPKLKIEQRPSGCPSCSMVTRPAPASISLPFARAAPRRECRPAPISAEAIKARC